MNRANVRLGHLYSTLLVAAISAHSSLLAGQASGGSAAPIPACSSAKGALAHATALNPQMEEDDTIREKWNRVPDVIGALSIREGSSLADVGSGEGFFTLRLACAVGPTGRVLAIDIDKKVLKTLKARLRKGGFHNVLVIRSKPEDPKIPPESIDAALFVGSYHEMKTRQAILEHVRQALKPNGRIVVMESLSYWERLPREDEARDKQERRHELDAKFVNEDLQEAHFQVIDRQPEFFRRVTEFSLTAAQVSK